MLIIIALGDTDRSARSAATGFDPAEGIYGQQDLRYSTPWNAESSVEPLAGGDSFVIERRSQRSHSSAV